MSEYFDQITEKLELFSTKPKKKKEEKRNEVMEKLGSPSTKEGEEEERKVIPIYSTISLEEPIICLRGMNKKKLEETQECFILDFDPFLSNNINLSNLSTITEEEDDDDDDDDDDDSKAEDFLVISHKGQVKFNPTIPLTFLQMGLL